MTRFASLIAACCMIALLAAPVLNQAAQIVA